MKKVNKELQILLDVLWVSLLMSLSLATLVCGAMYWREGALVMGITGLLLCLFFGAHAVGYSRTRGYF